MVEAWSDPQSLGKQINIQSDGGFFLVAWQIIKHGIKQTIVYIGFVLLLFLLLLITALVIILNIPRAVLKLILAFILVITKNLILISKPNMALSYLDRNNSKTNPQTWQQRRHF